MERIVLRQMAWERAKGELKSMLVTHVNEMEKYNALKIAIDKFIKDIEFNGKQE